MEQKEWKFKVGDKVTDGRLNGVITKQVCIESESTNYYKVSWLDYIAIREDRLSPYKNPTRPYRNAKEFLDAYKKHGEHIKSFNQYFRHILCDDKGVVLGCINTDFTPYDVLLKYYCWEDDTECGVNEQ